LGDKSLVKIIGDLISRGDLLTKKSKPEKSESCVLRSSKLNGVFRKDSEMHWYGLGLMEAVARRSWVYGIALPSLLTAMICGGCCSAPATDRNVSFGRDILGDLRFRIVRAELQGEGVLKIEIALERLHGVQDGSWLKMGMLVYPHYWTCIGGLPLDRDRALPIGIDEEFLAGRSQEFRWTVWCVVPKDAGAVAVQLGESELVTRTVPIRGVALPEG
jgi:hypothetical protein